MNLDTFLIAFSCLSKTDSFMYNGDTGLAYLAEPEMHVVTLLTELFVVLE